MNIDSNVTSDILYFIQHDSIASKVFATLIVAFLLSFVKKIRDFYKSIWNKVKEYLKKEAYEVIDLRKHVTVCKNGHLIILQDFRLKINKPNSTDKFHRLIDVTDGADNCKLPALSVMGKTPKEKRFSDYGFWYKSNPENIIEKVKETNTYKGTRKREEFYFKFNKKELNKLSSRVIRIMYGFSIRKGQPLTNGYFDYNAITNKDRKPIIKTGFKVQYKMNKINYIIGFIDNLNIDEEKIKTWYYPKGLDQEHLKVQIKFQKKDDLFYDKYVITVKKPEIGSVIIIEIPIKTNKV